MLIENLKDFEEFKREVTLFFKKAEKIDRY